MKKEKPGSWFHYLSIKTLGVRTLREQRLLPEVNPLYALVLLVLRNKASEPGLEIHPVLNRTVLRSVANGHGSRGSPARKSGFKSGKRL